MKSKVQIVATMGPSTKDENILRKMIQNQVDVIRLNFSWGDYKEHEENILRVRKISKEENRFIPIIQDLSGPRIQEGSTHQFDEKAEDILTLKDLADLEQGIKWGVDYVALSFVGSAQDVQRLKKEMEKLDKVIPVIAKIERKVAVENIDEIIAIAEAIMIARGDLGNEVPLEKIPFIEKEIIQKCKQANKPVIVATQMMLSMTHNATPTRAEITDIAYAVINGADAVMLSEESASGEYPLEAVVMMEKGILEAEKQLDGNLKINPL